MKLFFKITFFSLLLLATHALAVDAVNILDNDNIYEVCDSYIDDDCHAIVVKFSVLSKNGELESIHFQNTKKYKLHYHYLSTLPEFKNLTPLDMDKIALFENNDRRLYLGSLIFRPMSNIGGDTTQAIDDVSCDPAGVDPILAAKVLKIIGTTTQAISFDLAGVDPIPAAKVLKLAKYIKESLQYEGFFLNQYKPVINQLDYVQTNINDFEILKQHDIKLKFPTIPGASQIYAKGWQVGRLVRFPKLNPSENDHDYQKRISVAYSEGSINAETILILEVIPRDLPPVAGIISATVSSPNSHAALLAPLFGTVIVFVPGAMENKKWEQWAREEDTFVYLNANTIGSDDIKFGEILLTQLASEAEYQALYTLKQNTFILPGELAIDRTANKILPAEQLTSTMATAYGAKAINFGFLQKISPTPKGLGIPIYFQSQYFNQAKAPQKPSQSLQEYINDQVAVASSDAITTAEISSMMSDIRTSIMNAKIPLDLLTEINERLNAAYPDLNTQLYLRSSSNVEDLIGFNGAGLYDSKKLKKRNNLDDLAVTLKTVWASQYNLNAFLARKRMKINEDMVGMAILVNPFVQNIIAQGVITTIEPRESYSDYIVKIVGMFGSKYSVTDPPPGIKPEVVLMSLSRYDGGFQIQHLQYNDLLPDYENNHPTREILTRDQYQQMYQMIENVSDLWNKDDQKENLDLEWLLVRENDQEKIVLVQVRPMPIETTDENIKPFVMAERDVLLYPRISDENPNSMFKLKVQRNVRFSTKHFDLDDLPKNPFSKFEVEDANGKWRSFDAEKVFVRSSTEQDQLAWEGKINLDGFQSPIDVMIEIVNNKNRKIKTSNSLGLSFSAPNHEFIGVNEGFCQKWSFFKNSDSKLPAHQTSTTFYNQNGFEISINGTSSCSELGGTKHFFYHIIDLVTIEGLIPERQLRLKDPHSAVFGTSHHNFENQYAFDLFRADELTESDKQQLEEMGARFMVISYSYPFSDRYPISVYVHSSLDPAQDVCRFYNTVRIKEQK